MFADRDEGVAKILTQLEKVHHSMKQVRVPKHQKQEHQVQLAYFLETPNRTFAKHGLLLRVRLTGDEKELTLKAEGANFSQVMLLPVMPAQQLLPSWSCKMEQNIYPTGFSWQRSAAVRTHHAVSNVTHFGNLAAYFPGFATVAGPEFGLDADVPLEASRFSYNWLLPVEMLFKNPKKPHFLSEVKGTLRLKYDSPEALRAGRLEPLAADFEWKTKKGSESWEHSQHSKELLAMLTSSESSLEVNLTALDNVLLFDPSPDNNLEALRGDCSRTHQYSAALSPEMFRDRRGGLHRFVRQLDHLGHELKWFRFDPKKGADKHGVWKLSDTFELPSNAFAKNGLCLRHTRPLAGADPDSHTFLEFRSRSTLFNDTVRLARGPSAERDRRGTWECSVGASIRPYGVGMWQRSVLASSTENHQELSGVFPNGASLTHLGNLSGVFPELQEYLGDEWANATNLPLEVVDTAFSWLYVVRFEFDSEDRKGHDKIDARFEFKYASSEDMVATMQDMEVLPVAVSLEWRTVLGGTSWMQNDHSMRLLARLAQSPFYLESRLNDSAPRAVDFLDFPPSRPGLLDSSQLAPLPHSWSSYHGSSMAAVALVIFPIGMLVLAASTRIRCTGNRFRCTGSDENMYFQAAA